MDLFNSYVDYFYDSSEDYWKITKDDDGKWFWGYDGSDDYDIRELIHDKDYYLGDLEEGTKRNALNTLMNAAKDGVISAEIMNSYLAYELVHLTGQIISGNGSYFYTGGDIYLTVISSDAFKGMTGTEQFNYLVDKVIAGSREEDGEKRGTLASELRGLCDSMNLSVLFALNDYFMNVELRDFLNLDSNGTMGYNYEDIKNSKEWKESPSWTSEYHQTGATFPYLNAKYTNIVDGRELVFDRNGNLISSYPDGGTFNYVDATLLNSAINIGPIILGGPNGGHKLYDMNPYDRLMNTMGISPVKRSYYDLIRGNTAYWIDGILFY
jgi:hypothetical protein